MMKCNVSKELTEKVYKLIVLFQPKIVVDMQFICVKWSFAQTMNKAARNTTIAFMKSVPTLQQFA